MAFSKPNNELHKTAERLYTKLVDVEKRFLVAIANGDLEEANLLTDKATEIKKELDPLVEYLNQINLS